MASVARPVVDDSQEPPPGVLWWLISCDDSGLHGSRYVAYGTLWMNWQRRGEFQKLVRELRQRHGYTSEIKWTKVTRLTQPFYLDLVETFFRTSWLQFHCYLLEKSIVDKALHDNNWDKARQKHLTKFLVNKMKQCLKRHQHRTQKFRVWVDPIASSYDKADEVVHIVAQHTLTKAGAPKDCIDCVVEHDSKETPSIQLADLLLGAVAAAHEGDANAAHKRAVQQRIADHLGWDDLNADTFPTERKFNVWTFHDPSRGARRDKTRAVTLRYPLPVKRRG